MRALFIVSLIWFALDAAAGLCLLVFGIPPRTPGGVAYSVFIDMVFVCAGVYVLAREGR